jgi:hypothetical protein
MNISLESFRGIRVLVVMAGGRGYSFTGHHEIMIPLLAAAVCELSDAQGRGD